MEDIASWCLWLSPRLGHFAPCAHTAHVCGSSEGGTSSNCMADNLWNGNYGVVLHNASTLHDSALHILFLSQSAARKLQYACWPWVSHSSCHVLCMTSTFQ
eukprot:97191-Amphidinium_carterae.1